MSVVVKYVDLDDNLVELANSGELEGKVGERIDYSTEDEIRKLLAAAKFYESLNLPFLTWLASLRNDQERADKTAEWKRILKRIAITKAEELLKHASPRDIIGQESSKEEGNGINNIFTIFNWYKLNVFRHIK